MAHGRRGIILNTKYRSDRPFVVIGFPIPSPASECVSPLDPKGEEQHSRAGEGVGVPNLDEGTDSRHSVYSVLRVERDKNLFFYLRAKKWKNSGNGLWKKALLCAIFGYDE